MLVADTTRVGRTVSPESKPPAAADWKRIVKPVEPFLERVMQVGSGGISSHITAEYTEYFGLAKAEFMKNLRKNHVITKGC